MGGKTAEEAIQVGVETGDAGATRGKIYRCANDGGIHDDGGDGRKHDWRTLSGKPHCRV